MGSRSFRWLTALVFLTSIMASRLTAEIQCSDAVGQVVPCETFLLSGDAAPSAACCVAVRSLDKIAAASPADRRAICLCFKDVARSFPINLSKAQQLPKLCNVKDHVKVDPNVDCDRI